MPLLKRAIATVLTAAIFINLAPVSAIQAAQISDPGENISGIQNIKGIVNPDFNLEGNPNFQTPDLAPLAPGNLSSENLELLRSRETILPSSPRETETSLTLSKISQPSVVSPQTQAPKSPQGSAFIPMGAKTIARFSPQSKTFPDKTYPNSDSESFFDGSPSRSNGTPQLETEPLLPAFSHILPPIEGTRSILNSNSNYSLPQPPRQQDDTTKVKLPKSLWSLFWASSILTSFGAYFYILSQPFLVMQALKKSKTMMGVLRNIQLGTMALINFLPVGLMVDKTNFRILFVSTMVGRTTLMGAIPLLFFLGHLSFLALAAVTVANAVFQGIQAIVYGAASNAFVGTDGKLNKEASAVITKYSSLAGIIFPIAAGAVVGSLVGYFGFAGYAIAYGFYSLFLLAAIPVYWFGIKDPRQNLEINTFGQFFRAAGRLIGNLFRKTSTAAFQTLKDLSKSFQFKNSNETRPRSLWLNSLLEFLSRHEATQGLAYILKNKVLKVWLFSSSLDSFLSDALPLVVFPIFIGKLLVPPAHLPAILTAIFGTAGGVLGLTFAVESLGLFLGAWLMQGSRGDALINKMGIKWFYRIAGSSSPLFWLMWLFPAILFPGAFWINLPIVLTVQLLTSFFHAPLGVAMAPVVRKEIPDDYLGRVASALFIAQLLSSALGGISMGVLLDFVSINSAMLIAAASVTLMGIIDWIIPHWLSGKTNAPVKAAGQNDRIAMISLPNLRFA